MGNDQRSRRQRTVSGSGAQSNRRSLGSRMGLEKREAPRREPPTAQPREPRARRPQATQQINPQKAGYRPGSPRKQRRVTQAELIRQRNRRRAPFSYCY